jgi:cytochrome c556
MRTVYWLLTLVVAVLITAFATLRVGSAKVAAPEPAAAAAAANPVGTVRDVMKGIVDPNATAIWDSVGTESNDKGLVEKSPKTDEEWAVVERQALTLAEAANLLITPGRHLALPEEANYKSKPDAPELTPTQIEQKIAANPGEWVKHAKDLQATAVKAMAAAKAKDKDALLNVGEAIDNACESCHLVYWYPDDKPAK